MTIENLQTSNEPLAISPSRVRELGAYYTSTEIASSVAAWAIKTGDESVLEPSVGGGALLRAAYSRAKQIKIKNGLSALAFDIDSRAIANLRKITFNNTRVYRADFLKVNPRLHNKVDLVLANPPFTRNHEIDVAERDCYRARFGTTGAVGLWVYFILHSMDFLVRGGRLASIVPRSILFTLHGRQLLKRLCQHFAQVGVYELEGKAVWSSYAEEDGAVILAEGFGAGICNEYLRGVLKSDGSTESNSNESSESYKKIVSHSIMLDSIASLSIGAVTGRNEVFLLNEDIRKASNIGLESVRPVISRRKQIKGITITNADLQNLAIEGHRTWLLAPDELTHEIEKYLEVVSEEDRNAVVWFKKRSPWWKVQIASDYDAVFTYMNDLGPRLVRLDSNIVCTNTLHKVRFKKTASKIERNASLLSPISTFGQLAAERLGRRYSGGVLKFEIAEAKSLPIISCSAFTDELVERVDNLLRNKLEEQAVAEIDKVFMPLIFGSTWKTAQAELAEELEKLRLARRKVTN